MNADELSAIQAPPRGRYRAGPWAVDFTAGAVGKMGEGVTCRIATAQGDVTAGLHPVVAGTVLAPIAD